MGKKCCEMAAILLCLAGMVFIAFEGKIASMNHKFLQVKEKEIMSRAIPSMSQSLCDQTKLEIKGLYDSSSSPSPILTLLGESLDESIPVLSLHLSQDVIQSVVMHAGFFPSNLMNTLQELLEYNLAPMSSAVSQLLSSISSSYYTEYQTSHFYPYKQEGDYAALVAQVFSIMTGVSQLSDNTDIPVQDSWLGNFLIAFPNITYQTAVASDNWTNGFNALNQLARSLGQQQWRGSYFSGNDPDEGLINWECPGCNQFFNNVGNQALILARGAFPQTVFETGNTQSIEIQ